MATNYLRALPLALLVIAMTALLAGSLVRDGAGPRRAPAEEPWIGALEALDEAVSARDAARAARVWPDAWRMALASRRWDAVLALGDLTLRTRELEGTRSLAEARARDAYRAALFRARSQRSVEGVLRAAEAMAAMGDRDMPMAALKIARGLAMATGDAAARDDVERSILCLTSSLANRPQASP